MQITTGMWSKYDREFKLKSVKGKFFSSLQEMKEFLGLKKEDTVFGYCKRTGDVIFYRELSPGYSTHFRTFYNHKKGIGI